MMTAAGRTIGQVAEDLADRHDLAPGSALRLARVFQEQAARADGVEADEAHVTDSQERAIEHMAGNPDIIALDADEHAINGELKPLRRIQAGKEEIIADGELRATMTRAADDGMSVGRLAELTGLDRSDVLAMLGEGQAR
ncbi:MULTISPECIES: hypothetical protein [Bifidobacterium]|uniref:hypothetical protein n=1 Tax=Bifidobacterium TaxID=1678 RepID=UPI0018DD10F3|nr:MULTISPECIES: hypothetical protein [Bifidobacterium]MBH9981113.1 hypothetical protein [Bifidobacterium asteroides]MBI0100379.1 hypothetical protein [Bifidobacterium sp. W8114]